MLPVRDLHAFRENVLAAVERAAGDAAIEPGAEQALWVITRTLPSLLGDPAAATLPGNLPEGVPFASACAAFMLTPDQNYHLITAPVNFAPSQRYEKVSVGLGHPGHVARTRRAMLLRNTSHHESFVKILQTFRGASAMQVPMFWKNDYLGTLICASSAYNVFSEIDMRAMHAFAGLAAALWVAHDGPAWLKTLDYSRFPERTSGT
jgi:hypothetical protein